MKIAFLSILFKRYPLERVFRIASEQGYDGVELWGGRPHAYSFDLDQEFSDSILRMKDRYGLEVPMLTPETLSYPFNISSSDPKTAADTLAYLKRSVDLARSIQCPRVQLAMGHAGFGTSKRANMRHIIEVVKTMADYADRSGITLILEAVTIRESNTVVFLDDLLEILDAVNAPHVKAMLDTVTPCIHWETFSDYFELLGDKLDYIHFVDCDGEGFHHYPLGDGSLPVEALVKLLKKHNYHGWLSSEIYSADPVEPEFCIAREIRTIRRLLESEGIS